jgi:hypothetical protein
VTRVAVLYCDPRGPYPSLADRDELDVWDNEADENGEHRNDARLYWGPHPVVAHPPCGAWSQHRKLYRGNDADCGPRAVQQVRAFGGVLEHPAGSRLWDACGLPLPGEPADCYGGYTIEVSQVEWGHVARKRTWLYLVGVRLGVSHLPPPFPGREPTHWCSGRRQKGGKASKATVPPGIKVCSAQQRRRTPVPFAEWLIAMARSVQGK